MKAARVTKVEMETPQTRIPPSELFAQIAKKHGKHITMKDIKKDLRKRF